MKRVTNPQLADERITRLLAYYLWECRGKQFESPDQDWHAARKILRLASEALGKFPEALSPPLRNASAVLDTNAYRTLGRMVNKKLLSLTELAHWESLRGVTAYASPIVIMELAAHLWDPTDDHYSECRDALTALYEHCRTDAGQLRCMADSESLIAHLLYGTFPPSHPETIEKISKLAKAVADANGQPLASDVVDLCKALADHIGHSEKAWAGDIQRIVQWLRPGFSGWDPFSLDKGRRTQALAIVRSPDMLHYLATAYVVKARDMLGIPQNSADTEGMADEVLKRAGPSIAIYRSILELLVTEGWNPSKPKNANSLWDMQVVVGVGEELNNELPKMIVVTADRGMLRAAEAASRGDAVISLGAFLMGLQLCK